MKLEKQSLQQKEQVPNSHNLKYSVHDEYQGDSSFHADNNSYW